MLIWRGREERKKKATLDSSPRAEEMIPYTPPAWLTHILNTNGTSKKQKKARQKLKKSLGGHGNILATSDTASILV